jgi:hypothetical protein
MICRPRAAATALLLAGLVAGCASPRPVLYPDDHYNQVGPEVAEADIEACMALADQAGHETDQGAGVATNTAVGAGVGAAGGSAVGAIFGSVGRGAATGAVSGAVGGLIRGMMNANQPGAVYKNFVNQCLSDRGYRSIGWK